MGNKKEKWLQILPFKGKTAILCGASEGIGFATAKLIAQLGGNVCIVARRLEKLEKAAEEINTVKADNSQFVEIISCDTTDMDKLKPLFDDFIKKHGVPDYLLNFVGYAYPNYIQNLTLDDLRKGMEVNYFGQLVPILIILPYYMEQKQGYITTTSSVAGFMGLFGYLQYCPTKFAIVGMTETLRNELRSYNIDFSILFPPDTKTPGFDKENETKPPELAIMSERGGILEPDEVAVALIDGVLKKKFYITPGEAKFIWKMKRLFPNLVNKITDKEIEKARKKLRKRQQK